MEFKNPLRKLRENTLPSFVSAEDIKKKVNNLSKEDSFVLFGREGHIEAKVGKVDVSLNYEKVFLDKENVDDTSKEVFAEFLKIIKLNHLNHLPQDVMRLIDIDLIFENETLSPLNDFSSLKELKVYFSPKIKNKIFGTMIMRSKDSAFVYFSGPFTPAGISVLMHELGHIADNLNKTTEEIIYDENISQQLHKGNYLLSDEAYGRLLASERNAWAYAYKKLRPILSGITDDVDALKTLSHDVCLGSYDRKIIELREERKSQYEAKA